MPDKRNSYLLACLFAIGSFFVSLFLFLRLRYLPVLSFMQESNVALYFCSLIIFALVFFLANALFSRINLSSAIRWLNLPLRPRTGKIILLVLVCLGSLLLLHRRFVAELGEFAFEFGSGSIHQFSTATGIAIFLVLGLLSLFLYVSGKDIPSFVTWPFYLLCAVLCFFATLTINVAAADIHHGVAYLENIYNVYYGMPYNASTVGIYGHYGLFYGLILRLLGGNIVTISCMIAGVAALVSLCCSFVLHNTLQKNWMRILGTFACCFTVLTARVTNYYQVQPHRIIFPVLLLSILIFQLKKNHLGWKARAADYLLASLAILWNTESGLFTLIGLTGFWILEDWFRYKWYSREAVYRYLISLLLCAASLLLAMGAVFLYNCSCSWYDFDVLLFFVPLFTPSYMNVVRYDFRFGNSAWVYVLLVFSGALLYSLRNTTLFGLQEESPSQGKNISPVLFTASVIGLLSFSYYANRAAYYNLDITLQLVIIVICILADQNVDCLQAQLQSGASLKSFTFTGISLLCAIVITVLGAQSLLFSHSLLKEKYESGHWSVQSIEQVCQELQENVPEDTYAFGHALTIYYQYMGWDTQAHYTDFSDILFLGEDTLDEILDRAVQEGRFVTTTAATTPIYVEQLLEKAPDFELVWSYEEGDFPLQYWCRTGSVS